MSKDYFTRMLKEMWIRYMLKEAVDELDTMARRHTNFSRATAAMKKAYEDRITSFKASCAPKEGDETTFSGQVNIDFKFSHSFEIKAQEGSPQSLPPSVLELYVYLCKDVDIKNELTQQPEGGNNEGPGKK